MNTDGQMKKQIIGMCVSAEFIESNTEDFDKLQYFVICLTGVYQ
jgi:hypothetical protein